jgi:serine/threonine protein kinase
MDLDGSGNGSMGMKANMTNEELESMIREDVWKGTNHTHLPIDILRNLKVNVDMDDRVGYLGSGLWRQVWRLYPRIQHHTNINIDTSALSSKGEDAVLKIMKSEHDVNPRNFDRHRRDALVMERLTSNPHVVSGYGFCGNTVLTEFAGVTLDDFLKSEAGKIRSKGGKKDRDDKKDKSNFAAGDKADGLPQTHMEHSAKWKNVHEEVTQQSTLPAPERYSQTNPLHKIELALDVMRGLEVMHKHHMVHADIQSKQFLMDPVHGIKLNDFNRCRLLPKHTTTGGRCKVKIPSAPGGNRSPEEYEKQKVDTKIDIFSAGNVLFYILTGAEPWGKGAMKLDIQRNVKKGKLPEIKEEFLKPGTVDAAISKIVVHAFAFKPEDRWNATEIIRELQRIKEEHSSDRILEVK